MPPPSLTTEITPSTTTEAPPVSLSPPSQPEFSLTTLEYFPTTPSTKSLSTASSIVSNSTSNIPVSATSIIASSLASSSGTMNYCIQFRNWIGGVLGIIQNIQILTTPYINILGSSGIIALVINSLTTLVSGYGLIVICCSESPRSLKILSGLFIFIVILHFLYGIYLIIITAVNDVLSYFVSFIILHFVGAFLGFYFARVVSDYAKIVRHEKGDISSPRRIEGSNVTNNQ
ncbi:12046_t:CDS:2, partial [Dentiscutata erythropus]